MNLTSRTSEEWRKQIENTISDNIGRFLFYDRKESESLPIGTVEALIERGDITCADVEDMFSQALLSSLSPEQLARSREDRRDLRVRYGLDNP